MARSTSFLVAKIRAECTPDGGTVNEVTLPVNTNAGIDYETLRTQLASGERSLHPETAQAT